jgi:hypothetical protein
VLKPNFSGKTKNVLKNHKSSMINENTFKKRNKIYIFILKKIEVKNLIYMYLLYKLSIFHHIGCYVNQSFLPNST